MPTSASSGAATNRPRAAPYPNAGRVRTRRIGWLVVGASVGAAAALLLFTQAAGRAEFDKARAFDSLEKQGAFGPRVPGKAGHDQCLDYLVETLTPLADSVEKQNFKMT